MRIESLSSKADKDVVKFSGRGTIYSHTIVLQAPDKFEKFAPYPVAIVKLEEGPLVTAQLTDPDPDKPFEIGIQVEMVTRKLKEDGDQGIIDYGYKFRPPIKKGS